jgi:hypothetical protein
VKYQYDECSGHGVLQQQHDHSCMTMTLASHILLFPCTGDSKNESNVARCHVMNVVCKMKSGIRGDLWVAQAIETEGDSKYKFLFSDDTGKQERGGVYEEYMFKLLERVQAQHSEYILAGLDVRAA